MALSSSSGMTGKMRRKNMLDYLFSPAFSRRLTPTRKDLFTMALLLLTATIVGLLFSDLFIEKYNALLLYTLVVVIISSTTTGYLCGPIATVLSVFWVNYTFTYPYFALNFSLSGYPFTFATMSIVSLITSTLTVKERAQTTFANTEKLKAEALNVISWQLFYTNDITEIQEVVADELQKLYQCSVIFLQGELDGKTGFAKPYNNVAWDPFPLPIKEQMAVERCHLTHTLTGGSEDDCSGLYLPIAGGRKLIGVVGLFAGEKPLSQEENRTFLNTTAAQISAVLERHSILQQQNELQLAAERERMRSNLLRAISHDLRTPLTGIMGASSVILENGDSLDRPVRDKLLGDILNDSQWLIRMVENLLSITRINDDQQSARVTKTPEPAEEIIGEAISRVRGRNEEVAIEVSVPNDLLIVPMDGTLIEQVIINLVENAIKHSNSTEPIQVTLSRQENLAVFEVRDHGKGIPDILAAHLFDGASSVIATPDASRGMGIGLSICKSIVSAHQGTITGSNAPNGGAVFRFTLPLEGE